MNRTPQQILARKRNSTKWRMLGVLSHLRGILYSSAPHLILTPAERMQLGPALEVLEDIAANWNKSNTEFGLNNPDDTKKETN